MKNRDKQLVIPAYEGSYIYGIINLFFAIAFGYIWFSFFIPTISQSSTDVNFDFISVGVIILFLILGYAVHEFIQYFLLWIFGGKPRRGGRMDIQNFTELEAKYYKIKDFKNNLNLRSWSHGTEYPFLIYLFIVLSPTLISLIIGIFVLLLKGTEISISLFIIGIINTCLLPYDIYLALKLIFSLKNNSKVFVVDDRRGTHFLVTKTSY